MAVFSAVAGQQNYASFLVGNTLTIALSSSPTTGNLLCIGVIYYKTGSEPTGGSITSITNVDNTGTVFTLPAATPSAYDSNAGQVFGGYLLSVPAACTQSFIVTFGDTPTVAGAFIKEFSYTGGPIALDTYTEGTGTCGGTGLINTPTATVSAANGLGFAASACSGSISTGDSPWTDLGYDVLGGRAEFDLDIDSNQAVAYTAAQNNTWTGIAMTFGSAGSSTTLKGTTTSRGMFRGMNRHVVSG